MSAIRRSPAQAAEFDAFAENYDDVLNRAISVSGESKHFFARHRILHVSKLLRRLGFLAPRVLDYGCGTGTAVPYLLDLLAASRVVGVDVSEASLEVARRACVELPAEFLSLNQHIPAGDVDVAYSNGVFHHIQLAERAACAELVFRSLRPHGVFAFWENNPWNPGTRYCMRVNAFDRDAMPLSPPNACQLLRDVGFQILTVNYLFFFPRALAYLRFLEPFFHMIPLGAQYLVLCRRSAMADGGDGVARRQCIFCSSSGTTTKAMRRDPVTNRPHGGGSIRPGSLGSCDERGHTGHRPDGTAQSAAPRGP